MSIQHAAPGEVRPSISRDRKAKFREFLFDSDERQIESVMLALKVLRLRSIRFALYYI